MDRRTTLSEFSGLSRFSPIDVASRECLFGPSIRRRPDFSPQFVGRRRCDSFPWRFTVREIESRLRVEFARHWAIPYTSLSPAVHQQMPMREVQPNRPRRVSISLAHVPTRLNRRSLSSWKTGLPSYWPSLDFFVADHPGGRGDLRDVFLDLAAGVRHPGPRQHAVAHRDVAPQSETAGDRRVEDHGRSGRAAQHFDARPWRPIIWRGGNIRKVVQALIVAHRAKIDLDWNTAVGHRSGRPRRLCSRADQRRSQSDRLPRPAPQRTHDARRRRQERHSTAGPSSRDRAHEPGAA